MLHNLKDFWATLLPHAEAIQKAPQGVAFEVSHKRIGFQADTRKGVEQIKAAFPEDQEWEETFIKGCGWWKCETILDDETRIDIYAIKEAPPGFRAILGEKKIIQKIIGYEEINPSPDKKE